MASVNEKAAQSAAQNIVAEASHKLEAATANEHAAPLAIRTPPPGAEIHYRVEFTHPHLTDVGITSKMDKFTNHMILLGGGFLHQTFSVEDDGVITAKAHFHGGIQKDALIGHSEDDKIHHLLRTFMATVSPHYYPTSITWDFVPKKRGLFSLFGPKTKVIDDDEDKVVDVSPYKGVLGVIKVKSDAANPVNAVGDVIGKIIGIHVKGLKEQLLSYKISGTDNSKSVEVSVASIKPDELRALLKGISEYELSQDSKGEHKAAAGRGLSLSSMVHSRDHPAGISIEFTISKEALNYHASH